MLLDHVSRQIKIIPRLNADSTKSILFLRILISDTSNALLVLESNKYLEGYIQSPLALPQLSIFRKSSLIASIHSLILSIQCSYKAERQQRTYLRYNYPKHQAGR